MKTFTRIVSLMLIALAGFFAPALQAQSIIDPNDAVVTYNASAPPASPAWGTIGKWVRTKRLSWNTNNFKCYVYNGIPFRVRFPKTYNPTATDGKKYPVMIFWHGSGEGGPVTDNEYQLFHGGQVFDNAVTNGQFDGYIIAMQSSGGGWGEPAYGYMKTILDYMIANNKVDPFRVTANGLSVGGAGTWDWAINYTTYSAASIPMSAASLAWLSSAPANLKYAPTWLIQGGLDGSPDPSTTIQLVNAMNNVGANLKYQIFPNDGHDTWDDTWKQADFWPFLTRAYSSNPYALFGRYQFCTGDPINITVGVTQGFQAYEWRKDGVLISGATTNTIHVTQLGSYDARVQKGGVWSDWSRIPLVVSIKQPTVSPNITIPALTSNVIPALDTSHGVTLQVPTGYASYLWQQVGGSTTVSTTNTFYATTPGSYQVKVTEQFGCSSSFSNPYTVINANGSNKPSPAAGLTMSTISQTALRLDWSVNPSQQFPQTAFEVYQASKSGGPYTLIDIKAAGATSDTATGLNPGGTYYYLVRAVNGNAGAAASNEAIGTTASDVQPPTTPGNLTITGTTRSSVSLSWGASTDNVGVTKYDIYVNGVKNGSTTSGTTFTVYGLQYPNSYAFNVTARDFAGNVSPFSNQVTGEALGSGLNYRYFTFTTNQTSLPDFTSLVAAKTGVSTSGVSLSPSTQSKNYAFIWQGFLHVTQAGTYQLRSTSVDGSEVYLGDLNSNAPAFSPSATPVVSNDGVHSSRAVTSGNITLAVGIYPIAITYFHGASGTGSLTLAWKTPSSGSSFNTIPNGQFADGTVNNGDVPAAPSGLSATALAYNKIGLNWTDNATNETAYEVWRSSTSATTGFTTIGLANPGVTTYIDSTVNASTKYYYQVRSINQFGQSAFTSSLQEAYWQLNNNFNDSTGNGKALTGVSSPTFDATTKAEGGYSLKLNGTSQAATFPTSGSFLQTAFNQRTIAGWIRSANNTSQRVIFDIGGSDNGLALILNNNALNAWVASGNSSANRASITAPYTNTTGWSHVAVVYNGDSLMLYVNGTLVASKLDLNFHSIGTTTNASRLGANNGTNASNNNGGFFSGWLDAFALYNTALDSTSIMKLANLQPASLSFATTPALPAAPAAPTALVAHGTGTVSTVTVSWTDNASNELTYQVYRSSNDNSNYLLRGTLPANATSFTDTGLFANAVYYYKVRAVNIGGNSAYSNEDSAHTANHLPVLTPIAAQFMRYGTQLVLNVQATDLDPGNLSITVFNQPGFATMLPTGNGSAQITFNPQISDQGVYDNITVLIGDANGGGVSQTFSLTVNDNFNPAISRPVSNVTLNAKTTANVNLSATDQNAADVLSWSFTGLPAFATPVINGGSAQLVFAPGYADGGTYKVQARVEDGKQGFDTLSFAVTVVPVALPILKTYIHFSDGSAGTLGAAPWNNTAGLPVQGLSFTNLKDQNGAASGFSLTITTPWQNISLPNGTNTYGVNTGNNSGIYPDAVLSSAYYTDGNNQIFTVSGLDTATKYNFTFLGSRGGVNDDRTSIYTVGGTYGTTTVSQQAANNSQNTVSVNNVRPNADSTLTITLSKGANAPYGYINALVIEKQFNDQTAPAKARDIAGQFVNSNHVHLTWTAAAYNANAYQVYRSATLAGPYTLLNPTATDGAQAAYDDSSIVQNNTYYYYVTATNSYGVSPSSDTLTFAIPNLAPVLAPVAPITVEAGKTTTVTVSATDAAGDAITLDGSSLPGFVSLHDNGDGTGTLTLSPAVSNIGITTTTIRAVDNHAAASTTPVNITVTFANLRNVYVNFNDGSAGQPAQGAPWNNMNSAPNAGATISNLKDDSAASTGFGIRLMDPWTAANNVGPTTGNNSGVYPDNVMQSLYYDGSGAPRHINITGLSSKSNYNVIFYAGRANTNDNRISNYTIGGQTVSLNAAGNTSQTAIIKSVSPDASGNISISIMQDAGSPFTYLNAMQIQYAFDTAFYSPSNLKASGTTTSTIKLDWISNSPGTTTGFEVWRSTNPAGPFNLLTTVAGTATTYTDGGLTSGSSFFYEVRALAGTRQSPFSEVVGGSTVAYTVQVQMNDGAQTLAQGGSWNSINTLIFPGFELPNMINTQNQNTGITLGMINAFIGFNIVGTTTGNNSGIYPDNVMKGLYYVTFGDTARLYVSGLNLTSTYNLNFFGSRVSPTFSVVSNYQVGNQVVTQNAANNISNVSQIAGIKPDSTGTIYFQIYNSDGGNAYLNALTIDAVPSATSTIGQTPVPTAITVPFLPGQTATLATLGQDDSTGNLAFNGGTKAGTFPNPFVDGINLNLQLSKPVARLLVRVTDLSGRIVFVQQLTNLPQGASEQRLGLNGNGLTPGTYFIQLDGLGDGKIRTLQVLKTKK